LPATIANSNYQSYLAIADSLRLPFCIPGRAGFVACLEGLLGCARFVLIGFLLLLFDGAALVIACKIELEIL